MKRFWNWLRPPQRKLVLIRRFSSRTRLEEYRSNEQLVTTARKILFDPEFQPMIEVLRNECPSTMVYLDKSIEDRAVIQARIEGYQLCINNLYRMATPPEKPVLIEPSFEQPENEPVA